MTTEFHWRATYNDSTTLDQYNNGQPRKYSDIDRSKLVSFELINPDTNTSVFKLDLNPDERFIYVRRNWMNIISNEIINFVYLVGWQKTVNGVNQQLIYHVFPDGHIEQHDTWLGGEPVYAGALRWQ